MNFLLQHSFPATYATGLALGLPVTVENADSRKTVPLYAGAAAAAPFTSNGGTRLTPAGVLSIYVPAGASRYTVHIRSESGVVLHSETVVATPTMPVQAWLPMMDAQGCCHRIVPIAPTTFLPTGNPDVTIDACPYPIRVSTYEPIPSEPGSLRSVFTYAYALLSDNEVRRLQDATRYSTANASRRYWQQPAATAQKTELHGAMVAFFMRGAALNVPVAYTPPTASNITRTWAANAPFSSAPICQFIDINWQEHAEASIGGSFGAVTASLGAPTTDPGTGNGLRAYMVTATTPAVINNQSLFSTIRIVRVTKSSVPTGVYTWPLTIVNEAGQTVTVNLSITVV